MLGPPLNLTMAEVARREGVTSLSDIELGAYCRHKGLYPKQIAAWRQAFLSGKAPQKTPPKVDREQSRQDQKRIKQLERELRRKIRRWLKQPRCRCCEKSSMTNEE